MYWYQIFWEIYPIVFLAFKVDEHYTDYNKRDIYLLEHNFKVSRAKNTGELRSK